MSILESVQISQVRNLQAVEIDCHAAFNLIHGENGSGKTSLLEAIHLLAVGKSFRSPHTETLINQDASELVVFARLADGHRIGLSRSRAKSQMQLRLDAITQSNWDSVAKLLPVLVLDASAFLLLEGGPRNRRQFMDWGVFHVEPGFLSHWRRSRKCLANRNHLLKQARPNREEMDAWDNEFCEAAAGVDAARRRYLDALLPCFHEVYTSLAGERRFDLALVYDRGWDSDRPLSEVLAVNWELDRKYRATQHGPQRADVIIKVDKQRAVDVLSRGQQKLLVSALKIAQGQLLNRHNESRCIYLVDDLPAELDQRSRQSVLGYLAGLESQLFVTCVDPDSFREDLPALREMAAFHVERGRIQA